MDSILIEVGIRKLKENESFVVPESDYGKAEIWLKYKTYFLFSIPQYGGTPVFEEAYGYHMISDIANKVLNWT